MTQLGILSVGLTATSALLRSQSSCMSEERAVLVVAGRGAPGGVVEQRRNRLFTSRRRQRLGTHCRENQQRSGHCAMSARGYIMNRQRAPSAVGRGLRFAILLAVGSTPEACWPSN